MKGFVDRAFDPSSSNGHDDQGEAANDCDDDDEIVAPEHDDPPFDSYVYARHDPGLTLSNASNDIVKLIRVNTLLGVVCLVSATVGLIFACTKFGDDDPANDRSKSPHKRSDVYIETNFASLLLLYVGLEALYKFYTRKFSERSTATLTLVVLFLSFGYETCGCLAQIVNLKLSYADKNVLRSIFVLIFHLFNAPLCVCLIVLHLKMNTATIGDNEGDGYRRQISSTGGGRHVPLTFLAVTQLLCSFSSGIIFLRGEIEYERSLKISDEIGHSYWIVFACSIATLVIGYRTNNGSRYFDYTYLEYTRLVLQGLALLASVKPIIIPLETLYVFDVDSRLDRTLQQVLIVLMIGSFVSTLTAVILLHFDESECDHHSSALKSMIIQEWPLFKYTWIVQACIFLANACILLAGFYKKQLFATNFSPLLIFVIIHAISSFKLYRSPNPYFLLMNTALVVVCGTFAFRDVYLFNYHVAKGNKSSDTVTSILITDITTNKNYTLIPFDEPDKTALNVWLIIATLVELVVSVTLMAAYLRTTFEYYSFLFNINRFCNHIRLVAVLGFGQSVVCTFLLLFGLVTFLSNSFTAETFGDHSIYLGLLSMVTSLCTVFASRFPGRLVPLAFVMQIVTLFYVVQFLDFGAFCLRRLLVESARPDFRIPNDRYGRSPYWNAINLAVVSFVLMVLECVVGFVSLICLNDVVKNGNFRARPQPTILSTFES